MVHTRALETYWAGFTTWWLGRLDRRWRRSDLGDRLARAALDVGEAIVAARHGPADVRLHLDQLAWLVEIAASTRFLSGAEHHQVKTAIGVVTGMSTPARAVALPAVTSAPTPA